VNNQYYNELFERLLEGKLSPDETSQLLEWLNRDENAGEAAIIISSRLNREVSEEEITPEVMNALQARLPLILNAPQREKRGAVKLLQPWFKYAAAVVLIITVSFFIRSILQKPVPANTSTEKPIAATTDIAPGSQGAVLTLADGRKVVLDSLGNGTISLQTGAEVRLKDGQLVYDPVAATEEQMVYNSISTPKGRQFQLILPDGTRVWLNAASSLKYPTHFSGNERKVEIKGEAYFEVAKNAQKPFIVTLPQGAEVRVLGTHFNINAYDNEPAIKTTLLEGSVKIVKRESAFARASADKSANGKENSIILKPGEQAVAAPHSPLVINHSPVVDQVMAWKNGVFNFEDATLQEVMHQLERWYDIEVVYETGIPKLEFVGKMGRDLSLNNVLRGLELNKVHCRLEGRKLIVLP
jgi:ferric-dicitrate binding protein FerR (iron transport regulator)